MSSQYDMSGTTVERLFPKILKYANPEFSEQLQALSDAEKQDLVNQLIDYAVSAYVNTRDGQKAVFEDLVPNYFKYFHKSDDDEVTEAASIEYLAAHIILSELSTLDAARALFPSRQEMQSHMKTNDNTRARELGDQIKKDLSSNDPLLKKKAILQQQLANVIKQIELRDQREATKQKRTGGSSMMSQVNQ